MLLQVNLRLYLVSVPGQKDRNMFDWRDRQRQYPMHGFFYLKTVTKSFLKASDLHPLLLVVVLLISGFFLLQDAHLMTKRQLIGSMTSWHQSIAKKGISSSFFFLKWQTNETCKWFLFIISSSTKLLKWWATHNKVPSAPVLLRLQFLVQHVWDGCIKFNDP